MKVASLEQQVPTLEERLLAEVAIRETAENKVTELLEQIASFQERQIRDADLRRQQQQDIDRLLAEVGASERQLRILGKQVASFQEQLISANHRLTKILVELGTR